VDLKLGHYSKDGIEVVTVEGEIDTCTAPRLRELLIDLASKNNYQLIVNLDKLARHGEVAAHHLGLGVVNAQHPHAVGQDLLVQRDGPAQVPALPRRPARERAGDDHGACGVVGPGAGPEQRVDQLVDQGRTGPQIR
jgi:hypothetical protein